MPRNLKKDADLERMLEALGQRQENTICCGDGFNDICMLRYGGVGVAMGNAQPEVKAAADYITASNDEDGLVQVIDRFITNLS